MRGRVQATMARNALTVGQATSLCDWKSEIKYSHTAKSSDGDQKMMQEKEHAERRGSLAAMRRVTKRNSKEPTHQRVVRTPFTAFT